jgi:predicted transcriptional regulator
LFPDSSKEKAQHEVYDLLPEICVRDIIERTFPNPARMLRLAYEVLDEAAAKGTTVADVLDSTSPIEQKSAVRMTKQRLRVLEAVSKGPMTLAELSLTLNVDSRQLFTILRLMVAKGLLRTIKEGKRVHYYLTEEGNTALRLSN